ncbi:MAG: right-handed parallel beta-helix repeat-containing protein, partial [Synergistaceae bacterium]|nr:right-handed parallel beta-helix repeat-containing protein [Synergistaceae bacterium]
MKDTSDITDKAIKYTSSDVEYNQSKWSEAINNGTSVNALNTFLTNTTTSYTTPVNSGDIVYIQSGDYNLSSQIYLGSRTLHLYGGFSGDETTSSDRKLNTNTTRLSHSYINITSNSTTVDGFTITGSTSGGIYISSSSPTITNCTITGNSSPSYGGGIYISGSSSPKIINCAITGNNVTANQGYGGGIGIQNGNPIIANCTITGNTATRLGGGIYINDGNPTIINCTITGNNAGVGGGGIGMGESNNSSLTPTITNCTIVNNTASSSGNEIYFYSGTTNLRNTLIWNTANVTDANSGSAAYNNCAYPFTTTATNGNIALTTWENPVSSDVKVNGVTHKVYKIFENYSALKDIIGKGSHDVAPEYDQIGNAFADSPSIGAVEYVPPVLSLDITGTDTINTKYGTPTTETFTPIVSLDNVALTTGYTVSWDVAITPTVSTISISDGVLTVGNTTPAETYTVTVKAQATYTAVTTPVIKSSVAEKTVTITVAK